MSFQLNLFDEGIAEAYVIARSLKNHRRKIYKKCGISNCENEIPNRPSSHYCWIHIMENYQNTILLTVLEIHQQT